MIILRPVNLKDINHLERLADASGPLVSTLPANRPHLQSKIERSQHAFAQEIITPGDESYLFVLEDLQTGQLLGTGGINALAGNKAPFYSFRNDIKIHSSRELNVHNRIHALTLNHDLSDHSQLCSFYITPEYADSVYPSLITLARLLFMSISPMRFAKEWMAVLPGIFDEQGRAPFWEHVGRKFFGIDYNQVEYYSSTCEKTFIAEMMPYHPLYVSLIAKEAQDVMGLVHKKAELQYSLLSAQGFELDNYVEIFDAGPILTVSRDVLSLSKKIKSLRLTVNDTEHATQSFLIGFEDSDGFKACLLQGALVGEKLMVGATEFVALNLSEQEHVFAVAL
jgi:arginine N-succinyltransferase